MPIELRTGLPGSGKSLGVVEHLMEVRKAEPHRPVKALGITDLRDDLADVITEDDLKNWQEFPAGTIIVVDECQRFMPTRRAGDAPKWISDLSTHRHLGLDFILISQHPALIDPYVRRLVDRHIHTVRKFGTQWVERWSWPEVQPDPTSRMSQRSVERKTRHRFSKTAMQAYTSAELHTVKRRIPPFIMIGAALVVIVPFLGWAAVRILHSAQHKAVPQVAAKTSGKPAGKGTDTPSSSLPVAMTKAQWIAERVPRVPGVPWSAPIWDSLPLTTVPDLYCIVIQRPTGKDCACITEQGTKAVVAKTLCMQFATNGVYNPYRPKPQPAPAATKHPDAHAHDAVPSHVVGAHSYPHSDGVPPGTYTPPTYGPWNPQALDGSTAAK